MYSFHEDGSLPENGEVFVFGSNLAGIHGAGAARIAWEKFGAIRGIGIGLHGNSYALPTKNHDIITMELDDVIDFIHGFVRFTWVNKDKKFFVTRVGCGLAGFRDSQIAKHFTGAHNCSFAKEWEQHLDFK